MKIRRQLERRAAAMAALFVAAAVVPRAGFVVHVHSGAVHGHRHLHAEAAISGDADVDRLLADALGSGGRHRHPHRADGRADIESAGGEAAAHWHDQAPFQLALILAAPALPAATLFAAPAPELPTRPATPSHRPTRARAPPAV